MNDINILMLGGAKRVSVATKIALRAYRMDLRANLYSLELSRLLPIASVAEIIDGIRWNDPDALEKLHEVVKKYHIHILIPFVDGAISVVARYIEKYSNVWAPSGSIDSVEAMFDKCVAAERFSKAGLPIPVTYTAENPQFPLIAKPRCGSATMGIAVAHSKEEFDKLALDGDRYLIQQYIPDAEEITVDCYRTVRDGKIIAVVPRIRLEIQCGEVTRTRTIKDEKVVALSKKTLEALDLRGAVTIQYLRSRSTGELLLMEVNPRLGGGVVCSIHAGADFPEYIIADCLDMPLEECNDWAADTEIVRYPQEVVFKNGEIVG